MSEHSTYLQEGRAKVQKRGVLQAEEAMLEILAGGGCPRRTPLAEDNKEKGEWMILQPSTVNETELGAQEL